MITTTNPNPFELFAINTEYFIDENAVNDKYHSLQKQFHPDNFTQHTAKEKLMATQISANVVNAYQQLLNPVERGIVLLNLHGYSFSLDHYTSRDTNLLITQMQLRETLEQASVDQLPELKTTYQTTFSALENHFASALTNNHLDVAAETLLKMRYYQKLLSDLSEKQQEITE